MIALIVMANIAIAPIAEAVQHHGQKTPIGSVLRSAGWAQMPIALSEAGQFSAGVESAWLLQRIQTGVGRILSHSDAEGVRLDRSGLIRDLIRIGMVEGLTPTDPDLEGTIQDITSEVRTELIVQTQVGKAYGFANWKAGQDEDALDAFPAQELVRIRDAAAPRDWEARWTKAGGSVIDGRMVALKGDGIWSRISRFGTPYPPYDFGSGMWVEDVSRAEAVDLGLMTPDQVVTPDEREFTDAMQASVRGLSPELKQGLQSLFGRQVDIDGETIKWKGEAREYERDSNDIRQVARSQFGRSEAEFGALQPQDDGAPDRGSVQAALARANSVEISAVVAGRKPVFHEDWGGTPSRELDGFIGRIRRGLPPGVFARHEAGHIYVWHGDLASRFLQAGQDPFTQIHRLTQLGENGSLLGFGQSTIEAIGSVAVHIRDSAGRIVSGFHTHRTTADLYAAARVRDWVDATGAAHSYEIIPLGGAE